MAAKPVSDEALASLAYTAFKAHYIATARPGWPDPKTHWDRNPPAGALWLAITAGIISGADGARAIAAAGDLAGALPGLGAPLAVPGALRPGPVTPAASPALARLAARAAEPVPEPSPAELPAATYVGPAEASPSGDFGDDGNLKP